MAEEVGGIVYEVGMDVKGLKAGQAAADSALSEVEKSAKGTTDSFNKLDKYRDILIATRLHNNKCCT